MKIKGQIQQLKKDIEDLLNELNMINSTDNKINNKTRNLIVSLDNFNKELIEEDNQNKEINKDIKEN